MQITPEEAQRALHDIAVSRAIIRSAVRAHHGHYHLWLWGGIWVLMALLAHFRGVAGVRLFPGIAGAGVVAAFFLGWWQSGQVRAAVDRRLLAAIMMLVAFGLFVWPFVLGVPRSNEHLFAYTALLCMQAYVIAGLWMDSYLLWTGLIASALILVGLLVFPAIFWLWFAVFGGGTLILTGFYVRYFWR
jgi:hypothetical protein